MTFPLDHNFPCLWKSIQILPQQFQGYCSYKFLLPYKFSPQHFQGYCLPSKPLKILFPLLIAAPSTRPRNYPIWPFTDRILISVPYALRTNVNFPVILGHCKFASTSANYSIEHSRHFFFPHKTVNISNSLLKIRSQDFLTRTVITECLRSHKSLVVDAQFFFHR